MSELHSYLRTIKRLGVRYVSFGSYAPVEVPVLDPEVVPVGEKAVVVSRPMAVSTPPQAEAPIAATSPMTAPRWLTASENTTQAMELTAFYQDIHECQNCSLGATRKTFVFGSGNPQAKVMFIGEAPGADEDEQGLPFVGKAGQLLTKIIESTQTWKRQDVFICNVLKCRPPGNRTPQPEEVEQCRPYLEEQIRVIQPKLILALGASAAQALLRTTDSVGKLRGRWHECQGIPLKVTYHPAALLRFDGYKKDVWQDMKEFTAKYKELEGLS
jgi:uracil-DNA glycosylase family 4